MKPHATGASCKAPVAPILSTRSAQLKKTPAPLSTEEVEASNREALAALDLLFRELQTSNAVVGKGTHDIVFDTSGIAPELLAAMKTERPIALLQPDIGAFLPVFSFAGDTKHICLGVTNLLSDSNIAIFPVLQQLKDLVSRIQSIMHLIACAPESATGYMLNWITSSLASISKTHL